ncbi:NepR family anti-sigma factor [Histidinibacterium lentulum]|nr:NepR family anti-sigma factor [Histidinibacterium lentulum]
MPKGHRAGDIDAHLRRAFKEIESDPLPERLLGLLEELRRREANGSAAAGVEAAAPEQDPDRG